MPKAQGVSRRLVTQTSARLHARQEGAGEGYDVYVSTPEPLNEGEEKHVISAFVADESGIINRVAGVFARRGVHACAVPGHAQHGGWTGRSLLGRGLVGVLLTAAGGHGMRAQAPT